MAIESISEANFSNQQQQLVINEQIFLKNESDKSNQVRITEKLDSFKNETNKREETTSKMDIDENKIIVFTKYDENGKIITRVPPNYNKKL